MLSIYFKALLSGCSLSSEFPPSLLSQHRATGQSVLAGISGAYLSPNFLLEAGWRWGCLVACRGIKDFQWARHHYWENESRIDAGDLSTLPKLWLFFPEGMTFSENPWRATYACEPQTLWVEQGGSSTSLFPDLRVEGDYSMTADLSSR